jgi:hypothetical protein
VEDLNELSNKDSTQEEEEAAAVFIFNLEVWAKITIFQSALIGKAVERDPVLKKHQMRRLHPVRTLKFNRNCKDTWPTPDILSQTVCCDQPQTALISPSVEDTD